MVVHSSHIHSLNPFIIYTEPQLLLNVPLIPCHRLMYFCSAVVKNRQALQSSSFK